MTDWIDRSLPDIAAALRGGGLLARELTEQAISRHEKWDDKLQAYKSWDDEFARTQADTADAAFAQGVDLGPAQGIPFSVKDLYGVKGFPTFSGSPRQLPVAWEQEGPVVAEIRHQLAVVPGKTHTVEFAYGGLGTNAHWGTPWNPWDGDSQRTPGGSSCGAGVSLWEGSALIAFGTDTGGSVRVPASMTGSAGLKTTKGRWSTGGITPLSTTLDTPGILAKSVTDIAFGFSAIDPAARSAGAAMIRPRDIGSVTVGVTQDYFWERCESHVASVVEQAIGEISAKAAKVSDFDIPEAGEAVKVLGDGAIVAAEGYAFLKECLPDWLETLDPMVGTRLDDGRLATAAQYLNARRRMDELSAIVSRRLEDVDVLLVPTIPATPPVVADVQGANSYKSNNLLALSNTMPVNVLGLCAMSIPTGLDSAGMPTGLQVIAKPGDEENLIGVALAIEGVLGTPIERQGKPPLGGA